MDDKAEVDGDPTVTRQVPRQALPTQAVLTVALYEGLPSDPKRKWRAPGTRS